MDIPGGQMPTVRIVDGYSPPEKVPTRFDSVLATDNISSARSSILSADCIAPSQVHYEMRTRTRTRTRTTTPTTTTTTTTAPTPTPTTPTTTTPRILVHDLQLIASYHII